MPEYSGKNYLFYLLCNYYMIKTDNNKDIFEKMARDYIREDSHWGSDLDLIKTSFNELIKRENNPKWLDIGCGPAFHVASIGEFYPEVKITGIDYSPFILEQAKKRIRKLGLENITLIEEDIIKYPLNEKYDLITFLNNGFGNLYQNGSNPKEVRDKVINKIVNSLNKEGYFILSVYNKRKLNTDYGPNLKLLEDLSDLKNGDLFVEWITKGVAYYSHWFSEKELYELEKIGLKLDFLEERMSRFLARYKKLGVKNES